MITLESLMPSYGRQVNATAITASPLLQLNWCWYPDQDLLQIEHLLIHPDGKQRMIEFQQTRFWKSGIHPEDRFKYQSDLGAFELKVEKLTSFRFKTWHSGERHLKLYGFWAFDKKKQMCFMGKAIETGVISPF